MDNKDAPNLAEPTILRAEPGVIIDCADDVSGGPWIQHSGDIYKIARSSTVMGPPDTQVHVDGRRLTYVSGTDSNSVGTDEWKYVAANGYVYVNIGGGSPGTPHQTFIGDKRRDPGIEVFNSDNAVIDGFTILHSAAEGINVKADTLGAKVRLVTVKNCTVGYSWNDGIKYYWTTAATVSNNASHDNGGHGILISRSDTCGVVSNESYLNDDPLQDRGGKTGIAIGDSKAGIVPKGTDVWVDYNRVHNNEDTGIGIVGVNRVAVRRNVSYANRDHGFDNNTTDSTMFINNTAFGNEHDGMSIENTSTNVSIYNCIFAYNAHNSGTLANPANGVYELDVLGATGLVSNNNVFVGWGAGAAGVSGERHLIKYNGTSYDALNTGYRTASGQDADSYNALPAFYDTTAGIFTIKHTAGNDNVVDAAKANVSGWLSPMWLTMDQQGNSAHNASKADVGSGPPVYGDIGAYEWDPRPAPTTNLSAVCDEDNVGQWQLTWSPVGEDSLVQTPNLYDVRYAASTITDETWGSATSVGGPNPSNGGNPTWWIAAPSTRHLALKTKDANGQYSALSNNDISVGPIDSESECWIPWYGGEGGGGCGGCGHEGGLVSNGSGLYGLRPSGGSASSLVEGENSILNGTPTDTRGADLLPIGSVRNDDGLYLTHLRVRGRAGSLVDGVKLLFVDHPTGTEAFASGSTAVVGRRSQASRAVTETGADVTKLLNGTGGVFNAASAVSVTVSTPLDNEETPLVIECSNGGIRKQAIIVESQSASGWQVVGAVYPRRISSAAVIDNVPAGPVRLRFGGYAQVSSVARLAQEVRDVTKAWGKLERALSSSAGDVLSAVGVDDTVATALIGPDTLQADFAAPPQGDGLVRSLFLGISATPLSVSAASSHAAARQSSLPTQFALYQNAPNPFRGSTMIRCDLPVGRMVKLEIFDVSGRRVRTLVNRFMPAGRHSLVWNQRDDAGAVLSAGVYFSRFQVDSFRDRKKLILMP